MPTMGHHRAWACCPISVNFSSNSTPSSPLSPSLLLDAPQSQPQLGAYSHLSREFQGGCGVITLRGASTDALPWPGHSRKDWRFLLTCKWLTQYKCLKILKDQNQNALGLVLQEQGEQRVKAGIC